MFYERLKGLTRKVEPRAPLPLDLSPAPPPIPQRTPRGMDAEAEAAGFSAGDVPEEGTEGSEAQGGVGP